MIRSPSLLFLLDTPNVRRGAALAGTPARVLALAGYAHRAGASVTVVLCDRGADYGGASDWAVDTVLVHPDDFSVPQRLATLVQPRHTDLLVCCEAEALLTSGHQLADLLHARLVYDVHDDEGALAVSLGESPRTVVRHSTVQRAALKAADHVIVSTRHEADLASSEDVPLENTALLPNGADPDGRVPHGPDTEAARLLFLGNLYYRPNALAVETIRRIVLPPLRAHDQRVVTRIVGRGPDELCRADKDIEFTGRVDSLNDALRDTTVGLAPLSAGSGAKMKVLDYLAAGLPVVGTSQAVTGLPAGHPGVIVEDDLGAWPSLLAALLRYPNALREIGRGGRICIENELSWLRIGTDFVRRARDWLARTPPPRSSHVRATGHVPRWLAEHVAQQALGSPRRTRPGRLEWLRGPSRDAADAGARR